MIVQMDTHKMEPTVKLLSSAIRRVILVLSKTIPLNVPLVHRHWLWATILLQLCKQLVLAQSPQPTMLSIFIQSIKTPRLTQAGSSVSLTTLEQSKTLRRLYSVLSCTLRMSSSSSVWPATLWPSISLTYQLNIRRSSLERESSQNALSVRIKPSNWLCQDQHQLSSIPLSQHCSKPLLKVKFYTPIQLSLWPLLSALRQKLAVRLFKTFHYTLKNVHLSVEAMSVLLPCLISSIQLFLSVLVTVLMVTQKAAIYVLQPSSATQHVGHVQSITMQRNALLALQV